MKSDEEILDIWINNFKEDYNETPEAIEWYISRVVSYAGGNCWEIYCGMIKAMYNIKENINLEGYVGFREDLIEELREEYE